MLHSNGREAMRPALDLEATNTLPLPVALILASAPGKEAVSISSPPHQNAWPSPSTFSETSSPCHVQGVT